jgi:hypothetical protein
MCRVLLFLLIFGLSARPLVSADEPQVDPLNARKYIGQSVTVSGVVVAVFVSKAGNVFINFGDKYPNQRLLAGSLQARPWRPILRYNFSKARRSRSPA